MDQNEHKGDTTRRILNRFQIMSIQCGTHSINSVPNWEGADIVGTDNGVHGRTGNRHRSRKANIWRAHTHIHTHDSFLSSARHAQSRDEQFVFRQIFRRNYNRLAQSTIRTRRWIARMSSIYSTRRRPYTTTSKLLFVAAQRLLPLKPNQPIDWFGRTAKLNFLEFALYTTSSGFPLSVFIRQFDECEKVSKS